MKAIILAAGQSSRLYPITKDIPKCLLELKQGKTIIELQISMLKNLGIKDILVVTGFKSEKIKEKLKDAVRYSFYKDYKKTNNLYTLNSISKELDSDILILFSDIIISFYLLAKCANSIDNFNLLIDTKNVTDKTMRVNIKNNSIADLGNHIPVDNGDANFIGIAKLSKYGALQLKKAMETICCDQRNINDYYTKGFVKLSEDHKIKYTENINNYYWNEIDYYEDYKILKDNYKLVEKELFKKKEEIN